MSGIHHISDELFLIAAQTVADNVSQVNLDQGSVYPPLGLIRECSIQIAMKVCQHAYQKGKKWFNFFKLIEFLKFLACLAEINFVLII